MTTNVFDKARKMLATDSRWSLSFRGKLGVPLSDIRGFVDDTGFDKIAFDSTTAYMFAGPGELIERWKSAIHHKLLVERFPGVMRNFAVCMVRASDGELLFEHGQKISGIVYRFAGTGAEPAYECWKVNQDPQRAVDSAKMKDPASGGSVKYLQMETQQHNLNLGSTFAEVANQFLQKGHIMYPTNIVPVAQAVKDDPRARELVEKVRAGAIQAEAPSGLDPVIWTDDDVARLQKALKDHYSQAE